MSRPKVSVVTIYFQAEPWLRDAVASVLAQDFGDYELLLVDDGSTDGGPALARELAAGDTRLRLLEHADGGNHGMSATRNLGLRAARGEYVAFLDADDVWREGKLGTQVAQLDDEPRAAALVAPAEWWSSWSGREEDASRDFVQRWPLELDRLVEPPVLLDLVLDDEWASICDLLVRRRAARRVGGYELSFRGMYEDQAFHAKLCLAFPVFAASESGYRYRQHAASCTLRSHATGSTAAARRRYREWLLRYMLRHGYLDPTTLARVAGSLGLPAGAPRPGPGARLLRRIPRALRALRRD